ncbi:MAG: leucine-rich repeat domain-containing protein [Clostridia bacterium]|nr:leucine-rich repeat domain-containing protein [Clostridia bacterium]
MKKIFATVLCIVLLCTVLPLGAFTASADASGTFGDDMRWTLNDTTKVLTISGNGAIPDNLSEFEFYKSRFNTVVIGNGITRIGSYAFTYFDNITTVTLPETLKSIGSSAFYSCTSLKSVAIPNSVTTLENNAFYGCTSLSTVTVGNGLTTLGMQVFSSCSSLTSINLPESVKQMGWNVFGGCGNLTISCYADSYAMQYAKDYRINVKVLSKFTAADIVRAKIVILYGIVAPQYEVTGDGVMDVRDLVAMKKEIAA